jgi:membrane protease YdiL (CAAX protease family)
MPEHNRAQRPEGPIHVARYALECSKAGIVVAFTLAIAVAEATGAFGWVVLSTLQHAIFILVLLGAYGGLGTISFRHFFPILALIPLLRILSLVIPIRQVLQIYWYAMIGGPLLIAVALTIRLLALSPASLGFRRGSWTSQILLAATGLPLSIAAFFILRPKPIIPSLNGVDIIIGSLILVVFAGFTEEVIFRGLLQHVVREALGRLGLLYSSALFAIMYSGSLSGRYVLFMGAVGLLFSWGVDRTGSLWGVVVAHGILNVGQLLVWPVLLPLILN